MDEPETQLPLLDALRTQIDTELAPLVARIDQDGLYPAEYLRSLGALGGFGASIPAQFGGHGGPLAAQIDVIAEVAKHCGSTAFLAWCQSVSAWYLLKAPNATVRERYLRAVTRGELLTGSGMSNTVKHLAGIEKIYLRASRADGGYRVDGFLPWVSNLGAGHLLITAAEVAGQGYVMFAVCSDAENFEQRPCPRFSGMEGTGTLNLRFHGVQVPDADVLAHPAEFEAYMDAIRPGFLLWQAGLGLGLVAGCLHTIRKYNATHAHVNCYLDDQEDELFAALDGLTERAHALARAADTGRARLVEVLQLRADASELALRAANSAVLHAGARGYLMTNPAQRRLREAIFVSIVTPALKHLRKAIHDLTATAPVAVSA